MAKKPLGVHGYVAIVGPLGTPHYFTGCGWSSFINEAKVFRTIGGAQCAFNYWEVADHNPSPLSVSYRKTFRLSPVSLTITGPWSV